MNIFRLLGDFTHLAAILILPWKMWRARSVSGFSARSQILYLIVFATRYLDLPTRYGNFDSLRSTYDSVIKIIFLSATQLTIYLMLVKFRSTYEKELDSFRIEFLLLPVAVLALLFNHSYVCALGTCWFSAKYYVTEVLWAFSIYLEAVAILPQLYMLHKTGSTETTTVHYYLFVLGSYRGLYVLSWVMRYYLEDFFDPIAVTSGCVQTGIYAAFFVYFFRVVSTRKNVLITEEARSSSSLPHYVTMVDETVKAA